MFHFKWWPFSRWTNWYARRQERNDARKAFPPVNAERALGYPAEVERVANQHLTTIEKRYNKRDRHILERLKHTSVQKESAKKQLDEIEKEYAQQPRRTSIGKAAHMAGLILFTVADIPLNLPPILYWLGGSVPGALLIALIVGFTLVVCAHRAGVLLREPNRTRSETTQMVGITLLACIGICVIAVLRQNVLASSTNGSSLGIIGFIALQTLIFFAAGFWSHLAHDPLRDKRSAYHSAVSTEDRLRVRRDKLFKAHSAEADGVVQIAQFLNSSYEGENVKYRDGAIRGIKSIAPKVPDILTTMPPEFERKSLPIPGAVAYRQSDTETSGRY